MLRPLSLDLLEILIPLAIAGLALKCGYQLRAAHPRRLRLRAFRKDAESVNGPTSH